MSNGHNSFQGTSTGNVIQTGAVHGGLIIASPQTSHATARTAAAGSTADARTTAPRHDRTHTADEVRNTFTGDVTADEVLVQSGGRTIHPASHIEPEPCAVCGQELSPTNEFCDWCHEPRHAD